MIRIHGLVEKIEGKHAYLKLDDNQTMKVAAADLNSKLAAEQAVVVTIQLEEEATLSQQELARTILNTLLNDERENHPPTTA